MFVDILTTGGTIDKIYFDKKSTYEIGEPVVGALLKAMNVGFEFDVEALMKLDSLDMTHAHRAQLLARVEASTAQYILITHGTDGMVATAKTLANLMDKTIVITGALQPAAFALNDAVFNIGGAVTALQTLPFGVYIVMNGQVFTPDNVAKNLDENRFEKL